MSHYFVHSMSSWSARSFAPSVSNVSHYFVHVTSMSSWSARVCSHYFVTRGVLEFAHSSNVSLFCPLPCLRGVLEFAPSVSNVLIILSTFMSSWSARFSP